ncbi:MAG TPA: Crp/Fnr family transcriptional regulator [Flavobacteriia bacterium]|nr:Crp/Fnr family transcriptional regulator [Flavobacteriia bacterium]
MLKKAIPQLASSKELLQEIEAISLVKNFAKDTIILKENSYIKVIPLLISGLIKIYKEDESGHEVLLYYIEPGESCIMSIMAAEKNEKITVKGIIEEDAQLVLIPIDKLTQLRKSFPQWNLFVYELFNEKFEQVIEMIRILTFSKKEKRLEEYLLKEATIKNTKEIHHSHQEIANELGSSREVISRLLKKLENDGKIELSQRRIKILQ